MDFSCDKLLSSIDTTVEKMTQSVKDECKKLKQSEIETEERKELRGKSVDFIRDINKVSAGRGTS